MKISGKNEWTEGFVPVIILSIVDDEKINDKDLDLLIVSQYGRNHDYAG